jgi:hypothetical protein
VSDIVVVMQKSNNNALLEHRFRAKFFINRNVPFIHPSFILPVTGLFDHRSGTKNYWASHSGFLKFSAII